MTGGSILLTVLAALLFLMAGLDVTPHDLDFNALIGLGLAVYALGRIVP